MKKLTGLLTVIGLLGLGQPMAFADEILPPTEADQPLILGLGVVYRDKPYEGFDDDEKVQVLPLIMWEGERFFFRAATGGFKWISNEQWEFATIIEGRGDGYDSGDADILAGMSDRDQTIDAGFHGIWRAGNGVGVKLVWVADTLDKSGGYETRGEVFYETRYGDWNFKPMAAYVYQSDDFIRYYYGVETFEAAPGRPAYRPDDEGLFRAQLSVGWNPGGSKWHIIAGGRFDFLGDEVDDSPIVEDSTMFTGFFAAGYRF